MVSTALAGTLTTIRARFSGTVCAKANTVAVATTPKLAIRDRDIVFSLCDAVRRCSPHRNYFYGAGDEACEKRKSWKREARSRRCAGLASSETGGWMHGS